MKGTDGNAKKTGQVFTPRYLADEMLDYAGYNGPAILGKHIIDNSCGDGAFLKQAAARYCAEARKAGASADAARRGLETYLHGIDTDEAACGRCAAGLSRTAREFGIGGVRWDVRNGSALSERGFDGRMDFVIGNPPYVRVHNLDASYGEVKRFGFANGGMTDLYLAFFELGFRMLGPAGRLCYITPGSWLSSVAGANMRRHVMRERNLAAIVDMGHFQPFENATAYTAIALFENGRRDGRFDYYTFDGAKRRRELVCRLTTDECCIGSCFFLSDRESLGALREIKTRECPRHVTVKNGFATLADDVFIGDGVPDSDITIKVLKASTGRWSKCLFPYDREGRLLPPEAALADPAVREHFRRHKDRLLKGRPEFPGFYGFGRTQAIADVWRDKIAVNTLLRDESDLKIEPVGKGRGLYSGLYMTCGPGIAPDDIRRILINGEFAAYVRLLKKYKSGGYYTFNSKDVQQYVNYNITFKLKKRHDDQPGFFGESA